MKDGMKAGKFCVILNRRTDSTPGLIKGLSAADCGPEGDDLEVVQANDNVLLDGKGQRVLIVPDDIQTLQSDGQGPPSPSGGDIQQMPITWQTDHKERQDRVKNDILKQFLDVKTPAGDQLDHDSVTTLQIGVKSKLCQCVTPKPCRFCA